MKRPLCVAILWHMHQPEYGNVQTGEIYLPWTRFHATKDYYDMAALAAEEPELHLTLNVVPSLMDQLVAYSSGAARETYASLTLRDASELDARERAFLLRTFFQLPWRFMLEPYARYAQLADRRGAPDEHGEYTEGLKRYSAGDYRDLQTWFNLAWCGRELRRRPEIAELFEKGRDFSEEEKRRVIDAQFRFAGEILPFYGRLGAEGRIELSCSPYYHPILPLLCDTASAREAIADLPLPAIPFAHPHDARRQIADAVERYRREFGRAPAGMWPSEGAVSDAALSLAAEEGLRWLASDEGVLLQSLAQKRGTSQLGAEARYSAHRWGAAGPDLFFRDHGISDLIGFTYSGWAGVDAAVDLLTRLRQIHAQLPADGRHHVVPIILDGENAWEHYPDNGAEFLQAFYHGLTHTSELRSVTFSEFLELEPHRERLPSITAGSWIGSSLTTWVGHPEKNRAWEVLACARAFLAEFDGAEAPSARREMSIAEGSDWFWWYGDDHHTQNAAEFDALFRSHVKNVYLLSGRDYPADLDVPIKRVVARGQCRAPVHTITPTIDGHVTNYFEWLPAGYALPSRGSMHRAESPLEGVYFGYDAERFYLRLDPAAESGAISPERRILVQFSSPRERRLELDREDSGRWRCRWGDGEREPQFAAQRILELALPLADLGIERTGELRFFVAVTDGGRPIERLPEHGFLIASIDPAGLDHHEWVV